jgi:hypothetical protein
MAGVWSGAFWPGTDETAYRGVSSSPGLMLGAASKGKAEQRLPQRCSAFFVPNNASENIMPIVRVEVEGQQIVLHQMGGIGCATAEDLAASTAFTEVVNLFVKTLQSRNSPILETLPLDFAQPEGLTQLVTWLRALAVTPLQQAAAIVPGLAPCLQKRQALHEFIEGLYDFWRHYSRFMILHSEPGPNSHEHRPYRAFNATIERLTDLVLGLYRDVCENVTGDHPRVYRQVAAGCTVGIIAVPKQSGLPKSYQPALGDIPLIRQVLLSPPLIIDPPTNTRTGQFQQVPDNPLTRLKLDASKFLCYPAQVGPLVIYIYFHQQFLELGCSLANLFDLATDEQVAAGPDAVYVYGAPPEALASYGGLPTVFYDDEKEKLLVGAVPLENRFGYFGYLKKMALTLHNIVMMKRGRMPYHGAMTRIVLKDGAAANVLLIGDTATGKSESLEAFRIQGQEHIRELRVIADDMGSVEIDDQGRLLGYGTEIGAFIRLDDLQQGYAFGQIDRAIIMSPQKVNARAVLPVTTQNEVLHGYPVDILLYANNYEEVDSQHPLLERFACAEQALRVFREGAAMAKGTTSAKGLVHSYFANIFGPPQYQAVHDVLAVKTFDAAFRAGVFVGQIRTRLGIPGYESKGPEEVAKELFQLIARAKR